MEITLADLKTRLTAPLSCGGELRDTQRKTAKACWEDISIIAVHFLEQVEKTCRQSETTFKWIEDRFAQSSTMARGLAHGLRSMVRNTTCNDFIEAIASSPLSEDQARWKQTGGDKWFQINQGGPGKNSAGNLVRPADFHDFHDYLERTRPGEFLQEGSQIGDLVALADLLDHLKGVAAHGKENAARKGLNRYWGSPDPYGYRHVVRSVYDVIHLRGLKRADTHVAVISRIIYRWATGGSDTDQGKTYLNEWKVRRRNFDYSVGFLPNLPPEKS